jgi:hypothetical protein
MKIFTVEFSPMWPVPCGLVINAESVEQAEEIAKETIKHTDKFTVKEASILEPSVIFYESGNY